MHKTLEVTLLFPHPFFPFKIPAQEGEKNMSIFLNSEEHGVPFFALGNGPGLRCLLQRACEKEARDRERHAYLLRCLLAGSPLQLQQEALCAGSSLPPFQGSQLCLPKDWSTLWAPWPALRSAFLLLLLLPAFFYFSLCLILSSPCRFPGLHVPTLMGGLIETVQWGREEHHKQGFINTAQQAQGWVVGPAW